MLPSGYKSSDSTSGPGFDFPEFNGVCAFIGRPRSRRQQDDCGDFVNLEDLSAQSSKILLGSVFIWMSVRVLCLQHTV
jgi:hypothetical protein